METNGEGLRDGLLSRLPQPGNLADYRREVDALLQKNEKGLKREKWGTAAIWIYAVLFFTAASLLSGKHIGTLKGISVAVQVEAFGLFLMIAGAVELLKHFINRARVELLREAKQTQLQILELREALGK